MSELSIEKGRSKLPKIALILGIIYLACSAFHLVHHVFFLLNCDDTNGKIGELLYYVQMICRFWAWLCLPALLVFYAREHRNRFLKIAAISYGIMTLISILGEIYPRELAEFFDIMAYDLFYIMQLMRLVIYPLIFFPLEVIAFGFLADSFGKNMVARTITVATIIIFAISTMDSVIFGTRHFYYGDFDSTIFVPHLEGIRCLMLIIGIFILEFFVGHHRKDKALSIPAIIAILLLLISFMIFKPLILYIVLLIAAIATIVCYFVSKSSHENSIKFTHIALLITLLYYIVGMADNLSHDVQSIMSHNRDIAYYDAPSYLVYTLYIFSIFLLPTIARADGNQDGKALKIAKILPFIAITVCISLNICLRYVSVSWEQIDFVHWFRDLFVYFAFIATAIMFLTYQSRNKTI